VVDRGNAALAAAGGDPAAAVERAKRRDQAVMVLTTDAPVALRI
jgi:hypothetical protein